MNCSDIHIHLLDYLDDNLNDTVKKDFESHIQNCKNCSAELEQFKTLNSKIAHSKLVESSEEFKTNFFTNLDKEEKKISNKPTVNSSFNLFLKVAAAILLFVGGTIFGLIIQNKISGNPKLAVLEQEVSQLKQQVHLSALKDNSPSEKILAIEYLNSYTLNSELLNTFDFLLNNDESINVRLEAAESLYKLSTHQEARDILLKSLNTNQKPIVQIKLINYLTNIEEKRAIEPLNNIIHDDNTNSMVKEFAQSSLQTLI